MTTARNIFNEKDQQLLVTAIGKAELKTSGEIRLHVENFCFGDEIKRANKIFGKLKMHQTKERNGILIYIAVINKKIAVVGDEDIHLKVGTEFWQKIVGELIGKFKQNKKADALADCIVECGNELGKYFPGSVDKNELTNEISY